MKKYQHTKRSKRFRSILSVLFLLLISFACTQQEQPARIETLFDEGKEIASKELRTTGAPAKVKLTADRSKIEASRNDLSYVSVEITDDKGHVIPNAAIPVTFTVSGVGEIAGSGNANPTDIESFNSPVCKTFRGKALAILRPVKNHKRGTITFMAKADGLETGEVIIQVE
ncbi:hypothetical protein [Marinilabilia sp.]|uniref:hypothetical protein n=1 Tax=Marinilabilia sp. TaxID=2021252 RepID=UPI0025BDDB63|nr:hypothetical protein [Marinilabilia sp.]